MLASLGLIFILGLPAAALAKKLGLPRIIGMLLCGILLGPYALGWLGGETLAVSAELRRMALVIILLRAGLTLDLRDLRRVGRPAVLMAFLPALFEIGACLLLAPAIFGVSRAEAAVLGAVLGAVSPAVVVPRMVELIEARRGTKQGVPQMILAGASLDDVFVIVLFSSFVAMARGEAASVLSLARIPVSVALGVAAGAGAGMLLGAFLARRGEAVRPGERTVLVLGLALLLMAAETALEGVVPFSGLLAVMGMAAVLRIRLGEAQTQRLCAQLGELWIAAEALLFVLVGAAVDVRYMLGAGAGAVALILGALAVRSLGVCLCTAGTPFTGRERLFCVLAYLPKATVQAAIGGVPLALGMPCGDLVLSVAVLSILLTAPLGAIAIDRSAPRLLEQEDASKSI
ncbi:MAG: cation:proton antiporter [Clostridiales bacterium]|nr:cation:proton antiporter [Clostridiales bacterium]MDY5513706.1 cation:proton antiporter [Candidatus Ventricola sp.]